MKRAQALYEAPVHLLYMARCERELGWWVEAAETFRSLSQQTLEPGAPSQFQDAVSDGAAELAELEPKIPRLLIRVEPEDAAVTKLTIDGAVVPSAVIGIERLANPGTRTIAVDASGYESAELQAEAVAGQSTTITIELESIGAPIAVAPKDEAKVVEAEQSVGQKQRTPAQGYEIMAGLRLGLLAPGGKVPARFARPAAESGDENLSNVIGSGGEVEFRLGFKGPLNLGLIKRWGVHMLVAGGTLSGKGLDIGNEAGFGGLQSNGIDIDTKGGSVVAGIGLSLAQARDHFGGFLEVTLVTHTLTLDYTTTGNVLGCGGPATATRSGTGGGLRASAGVGIPVFNWGLLTPYLAFSAESMSSMSFEGDECFQTWYATAQMPVPPEKETLDSPTTHTFFGVGLGGEVFLGL